MKAQITSEAERLGGGAKLAYIDCLRGYAVLMVMLCHTTGLFPNLPFPIQRVTAYGWHGVQLFFMASSLTLLLSAEHERRRSGAMDVRSFFIRRFLRIAPMYYLAAALYAMLRPAADASLPQLLATLAFVNAWSPSTMSTTGGWIVVPGGWSIGVEFTFYVLFPLFAAHVTSARRAAVLLVLTIAAGAGLNSVLLQGLTATYGPAPADNFLYFWFFNQAPVFAMGAIAYFAIRSLQAASAGFWAWARSHVGWLIAAGLAAELLVACGPFTFVHQLRWQAAVPQYLAACAGFLLWMVGMSQSRPGLMVNPLVAQIGKVSFSAYLLHFAVLRLIIDPHADLFHLRAQGWTAIAVFPLSFLVVVLVTCLASTLSYNLVEAPFMRLAKRLTSSPRLSGAATPSAATSG